MIVVSYVPLLGGKQPVMQVDEKSAKALLKEIEDADNHIDGCGWAISKDGEIVPIFVMKNAGKVADHAKFWADGDTAKYFKFVVSDEGDTYRLALMPNLEESVNRTNINVQLNTGFPMPNEQHQVLYKPLYFGSRSVESFGQIKEMLMKQKTVDLQITDKDMSEMHQIGRMPISTETQYVEMVKACGAEDDND